MRTLARDIKDSAGKEATVKGWLHKKRKLGGLNFLNIRDRSGLVQVLIESKEELEKLRGLQIGTVLSIIGKVIEDERAPGGAEIHDPVIEVISPVTSEPPIEIDKPLSHVSENLDTLFEHRVIGLRNLDEQRIFKLRAALTNYIREFFIENEFVEMNTPKIIAEATEGGAEAFKLDYFGKEAYLAQSPQFYKQMMVGVFERVFEIGPAFRAEPSMTTRHVSELVMLDMEMGFIDSHQDVLDMTQKLFKNILERTYEEHGETLQKMGAKKLVLKDKFPIYSVAQVHEMYSKATGKDTTKEKDLNPAEERWICDYAKKNDGCEAVFVNNFPVEAMKFYHMVNPEDTKTALWADLLFRGLEIATAPQREHRLEELIKQMKDAGLDPTHPGYKYYLQAFEYGLPPHGGFGFGIDRLVQVVTGLSNVKEAILFPRDMNRITP